MANLAEQEGMSDIWRGNSENNNQVVNGGANGVSRANVASSARSSQASQPNILRTVYLPNDQVSNIKSGNDQLNNQIQEQRA